MEKKEAYTFDSSDAENYDYYLGPILFEPYGQYLAKHIDTTSLSSVLELASGTGRVTKHIREVLPAGVTLWATDLSEGMLDIAKQKIGATNINFSVEDIQNLSFTDNTFDLVICQFGMMFLPDKKKGFEEIYRVLKPGGKFMFFTWDKTENMPLLKLIINDNILPYFNDEDTTRFFVPFSLHNPQQLADWMQDAGFKHIHTQHVTLPSGDASAENIEKAFFSKHPLGKEVKAKAPGAFEPLAKELQQKIATLSTDEDISTPLSAFLTTGVK